MIKMDKEMKKQILIHKLIDCIYQYNGQDKVREEK
jgi:hypothetical protein